LLVRKYTRARSPVGTAESVTALPTVSESYLRKAVKTLSIPRHFYSNSVNNRLVADLIANKFSSYGYDVRCQGDWRNIVALPRLSPARPLLLIGAHYDSVPGTPGSDDNASGVAALLACAKFASAISTDLGICFVAFNREEDGLIGSSEFRNPNYHGPGDAPSTLNYGFLRATTELLLAYALSTAPMRIKPER
jgi:hypothetical protein